MTLTFRVFCDACSPVQLFPADHLAPFHDTIGMCSIVYGYKITVIEGIHAKLWGIRKLVVRFFREKRET